jgi:hypothetical protein
MSQSPRPTTPSGKPSYADVASRPASPQASPGKVLSSLSHGGVEHSIHSPHPVRTNSAPKANSPLPAPAPADVSSGPHMHETYESQSTPDGVQALCAETHKEVLPISRPKPKKTTPPPEPTERVTRSRSKPAFSPPEATTQAVNTANNKDTTKGKATSNAKDKGKGKNKVSLTDVSVVSHIRVLSLIRLDSSISNATLRPGPSSLTLIPRRQP